MVIFEGCPRLSAAVIEDQKKIKNAVEEAEDELNKPESNRDKAGKALGRALEYSQNAK